MKFFVRLFFIVIIGCAVALIAFTFHPRCKKIIDQKITTLFETSYKARFTGSLDSISLLDFSVNYSNVTVLPLSQEKKWKWKAKTFRLIFNPLLYVAYKKIGLKIFLDECVSWSLIHHFDPDIMDHIAHLLAPAKKSFLKMTGLFFKNSLLTVADQTKNITCSCAWKSSMEEDVHGFTTAIDLSNGIIRQKNETIIEGLQGKINSYYDEKKLNTIFFTLESYLFGIKTEDKKCFYKGSWKNGLGYGIAHTKDRSFFISPLEFFLDDAKKIQFKTRGTLSCQNILLCLKQKKAEEVLGTCFFDFKGSLSLIEGHCTVRDLSYAGYGLDSITSSVFFKNNVLFGDAIFTLKDQKIKGEWSLDDHRNFKSTLSNITDWKALRSFWYAPKDATRIIIQSTYEKNINVTATYTTTLLHKKTNEKIDAEGIVKSFNHTIIWENNITTDYKTYTITGSSNPFFCTVKTIEDDEIVAEIKESNTIFTGMIATEFIQAITKDIMPFSVVATGPLLVTARKDNGHIVGDIVLQEGMIRIVPFYNFIKHMKASFSIDVLKRSCVIKNCIAELYKGIIKSSAIQLGYDYQHKQMWAHIPFIFDDCFLHKENAFYADISGALCFKKGLDKHPILKGFLSFDHAHLKENIFSQDLRSLTSGMRNDQSSELETDIVFTTKNPIQVKTPELETQVAASLHSTSDAQSLVVKGDMLISGGMVHFPAYSLPIIKGSISFKGQDIADPLIELSAQGRIKKYNIMLNCSGTVSEPQIIFNAVPLLSQEQIMMLLFAGSEEESFNKAVPSLIMRNVENIIFGTRAGARIKKLMEPFGKIKFIPRFTDQTGRGGFRGGLEIEVTKRLRAMIEKNFSLTEDVAFEVEYALTDTMSIKATRDERGDLGAEIEMRFKF